MKVQTEVSIYPLKSQSLSEPIEVFCRTLRNSGLDVRTRSMSTFIIGESDMVFTALHKAFEKLAEQHHVVMDFQVTNACPDIKKVFIGLESEQ